MFLLHFCRHIIGVTEVKREEKATQHKAHTHIEKHKPPPANAIIMLWRKSMHPFKEDGMPGQQSAEGNDAVHCG